MFACDVTKMAEMQSSVRMAAGVGMGDETERPHDFFFLCRIHLWFRYVGGFVRQVDDVTAQPFQRTVTPARATP